MNKTELIKKVAAENGLSQKAAAAAVDSVLSSISDSLAAHEPVTLIGFGTFTCRHRDARVGRNPATGKKIKIAASNTPIFKAGKLVYDRPTLAEIKAYCAYELDTLWDEVKRFDNPHNYYVDLSEKLWNLKNDLLRRGGEQL